MGHYTHRYWVLSRGIRTGLLQGLPGSGQGTTYPRAPELGLEAGWAVLGEAATSAGVCESQGWRLAKLAEAQYSTTMQELDLGVIQVGILLGCANQSTARTQELGLGWAGWDVQDTCTRPDGTYES